MRYYIPRLMKNLSFALLLFSSSWLSAQTGILLNTDLALESYTLIHNFNGTYLIDNCGEVVNEWDESQFALHPKLLPNGNLLFIQFNRIVELDWDGNMVNTTINPDNSINLEYEVITLANGNYLTVGRKDFSTLEFEELGYNYGPIGNPDVVDVVVEINKESGEIVWMWNISDHVIQERDSLLNNYGPVVEHPELLNMDRIGTADWTFHESFMINGMDYNPELDQIALSVRKMSEVVIIDHSTTTEEATGHTGGNSGKGGDILYRWGNPQNYGQGTPEDRQLYFQHNPNWITHGEHTGKIIAYDNGLTRPDVTFDERYSTAPIIAPPMDVDGNYILEEDQAYGPALPTLRLSRIETGSEFYSSYTSGAEVLPNGNIFITEGVDGRLIEFTPEGETVWAYTVPLTSYIFRSEKYPLDYPAFADRDLTPNGPLTSATSIYECNLLTSSDDILASEQLLTAQYRPATRQIAIQNPQENGIEYALYNLQGQMIKQGKSAFSQLEFDASRLAAGLYLVHLTDATTLQQNTLKLIIND